MTCKKHILFFLTLTGIYLCASSNAFAYLQAKCSNGKKLAKPANLQSFPGTYGGVSLFGADSGNFPSGSVGREAINNARSYFNQTPSNTRVEVSFGNVSSDHNDNNSVFFLFVDLSSSSPGAYAVHKKNCTTGEILATDIGINFSGNWTATDHAEDLRAYGGEFSLLTSALLHEMGHAYGLEHEADVYNIMGDDSTHLHRNGSKARTYVGEDASHGLVNIYGAYPNQVIKDLAVTHWRRIGSKEVEGQLPYSTHFRTRVTDIDGNIFPMGVADNGELYYEVPEIEPTVYVEFGFENNGLNTISDVLISYYLSTNEYITTGDLFLGNYTRSLTPDSVTYPDRLVFLPDNLEPGKIYYIGAIVDRNDKVNEIDESQFTNNSYVPIKIKNCITLPGFEGTCISFP